jgi:hypothetical protein
MYLILDQPLLKTMGSISIKKEKNESANRHCHINLVLLECD